MRLIQPRVIELFAGAGLLGLAFREEGFRIVQAIELDRAACATYAMNLGNHVECRDVRTANPDGRCEVIVAGPPCQGFSTLGKRMHDDPRNALSLEVVRWVRQASPVFVVIENVEAFLRSPVAGEVRRQLTELGYAVTSHALNANDFGVPQFRARSFTVASRIGTPRIESRLRGPRTVREAWEGLSERPDGKNNHFAPLPSALAKARMKVIPPGGDKRDVMRHAPELSPASWWRLKAQVTDVWGRMAWNEPSNTLRTSLLNPSKGRYIHPSQHRVISLREAARLHTIPDDFQFKGYPTHIAMQIGNSVPPNLGRAVAAGIMELF